MLFPRDVEKSDFFFGMIDGCCISIWRVWNPNERWHVMMSDEVQYIFFQNYITVNRTMGSKYSFTRSLEMGKLQKKWMKKGDNAARIEALIAYGQVFLISIPYIIHSRHDVYSLLGRA